jgi:hypothetical protein
MGSFLLFSSTDSGTPMPIESGKESIPSLKLTKPSIVELRSVTSVFGGLGECERRKAGHD